MSQSHEPSYYEIALTNRQVLIVFVVLLICVVVAFFSGVWVGQRDAPAAVTEVAQGDITDTEATTEEGAAIGELHFFADEGSPTEEGSPAERDPSLAEIAAEPQSETTLLEDLGGDESEPAPREPVAERPAPEPAPRAASPAPAETTPSASGYVIQVFSSPDEVQARRLLKQLGDAGYPAFLSPVEVGNQTMMRVRIGPYTELTGAESVAERIRREFKLDTWVTR